MIANWHPYWHWGGASALGKREEQQDCWGVWATPDKRSLLAVVADGMGGHGDGALAAQAAVKTAEQFVREQLKLLEREPHEALQRYVQQAQAAVETVSRTAHTTLVALWLHQDQAHWTHIGDSRLYQLRAGKRVLRTRDHSAAQMLFELGEIRETEMALHPMQNRLYRSLGGDESPKFEINSGTVMADDLFALCSDGAWSYLSEAEFWISANAGDPEKAACELVARAVKWAGDQADNATLVLIRCNGLLLQSRSLWRRLSRR
ncbi:MAG: protein phosphatase 2C domain-containing protein [Candidatus Competibacteraceae bacterium]|jgi:serine/threonine protein phosphatase PrpC|nr:protein phosphatase 2C domain-containing protein [Candidatus Competibacteraceae bacterium]